MSTIPDEQPVSRARRIHAAAAIGEQLAPDDLAWLAQGLGRYLIEAPRKRLDDVLGLQPRRGEQGWWLTTVRADRNAVLIEMDRQLFGTLDVTRATRAILNLLARQRERRGIALALNERELLARLARTGKGVPAERQLRDILKAARAKSYHGPTFHARISQNATPNLVN